MAYEVKGFPDAAFASYQQAEALDRGRRQVAEVLPVGRNGY